MHRLFHLRFYKANERIYQPGTPAAVYYIASGSVGLFKQYDKNPPERIQYINAGHWFGFSALFTAKSRCESARALEDSKLLALCISDYEELSKNNPFCALKIAQSVGRELTEELSNIRDEYYLLTSKLTYANILV
ncbi:cyclic nucleotide-binding domain-containing protein [candidate division KSB1 bacterium]|nr:cyclic nucleotide-binding domain-containing protein [candidate division KSB1 bacterium]